MQKARVQGMYPEINVPDRFQTLTLAHASDNDKRKLAIASEICGLISTTHLYSDRRGPRDASSLSRQPKQQTPATWPV
jgi:hypothetical protein